MRYTVLGLLLVGGIFCAAAPAEHPWADAGAFLPRNARALSEVTNVLDEAVEGGHEETPGVFQPIVFFLIAYTLSAVTQQVVVILPKWLRPPHSVILYLLGMLLAFVGTRVRGSEFGDSVASFLEVDPHVIFWVFLPMLLYEDASNSSWHVVRRVFPSAILLAFPGVMINTVLTAAGVHWVIGLSFEASLVLGSILSATDPVAVIASLNALKAPLKLSSLIAGEALLNDGSSVVIFQIFVEVAAGRSDFKWLEAIGQLFRLSLGGPALGIAVGLLANGWLRKTRNFKVEMLLILICVYGLFLVAEHPQIHVSGVLAVVSFGFFFAGLGKYSLSVENRHQHHAIVSFIGLLSNEGIFIIAGVVGYGFTFGNEDVEAIDWLYLFLLYLGVHLTRSITLLLLYPALRTLGYHLSPKEAVISMYAGLRGAVGLAIALLVLNDTAIDLRTRHKIVFYVNGIVLGTLLINGTTVSWLYKKLQIQSPHRQQHHEILQRLILKRAEDMVTRRVDLLKKHWFFQQTDVDYVVENLIPKLSDAIKYAEEDFYGRLWHPVLTSKKIVTFVDKLMDDVPDYDETWAKKEAAAHEHDTLLNPFRVDIEAHEALFHHVEELMREVSSDKVNKINTRIVTRDRVALRNLLRQHTVLFSADISTGNVLREVLQMISNIMRTGYETMFEKNTLNRAAFVILRSSVEHQLEAIEGDLTSYSWLRKDLPKVHLEDDCSQMAEALNVGWLYIKHHLQRTGDFAVNRLMQAVGKHRSRSFDYWVVMRNTKVLLAYNCTLEDHIAEIQHIKTDLLRDHQESRGLIEEGIIAPMRDLVRKSRAELRRLMEEDPAMFRIYEHLFCARMILVHQRAVLTDLAEEGNLEEHDLNALRKNVIRPSRLALCNFVPARGPLEKGRSPNMKCFTPTVDKFIRFMNLFTLDSIS